MRVFVDPTELGKNSTLPKSVREASTPLSQLEEKTGADLLLSILSIPAGNDALFSRHCQDGALVQLKRLNDLQSSITDGRLFNSLFKMKKHSERPWLVVTGVLLSSEGGHAVIGETQQLSKMGSSSLTYSVTGREGLSFASVQGALDAWQYYGGYVAFLPSDDELFPWLERQAAALEKIKAHEVKELSPRSVQRELVGPTKIAWLASLFDGVGQKTAERVFERLRELCQDREPELYEAMAYVTDYAACEIPGITRERVDKWRELLGIMYETETEITPALYATLGLEWRLSDTGEVYWRGVGPRYHYRNDGYVNPAQIFTPNNMHQIISFPWRVVYKKDGAEKAVEGILESIVLDQKFEWAVIAGERIRLDWIVKIEMSEGDNNG